ncbi:MAG: VanZ family protein [Flavobacteriaceae bacterium]|nr:VanZ family protein [Flavobacteriaceae bacterium]
MLKPTRKLLELSALPGAILLTILIAFLSLITSKSFVTAINVDNSDKYGHFISYFLLAYAWLYATRPFSKISKTAVVLSTIFYGIILEVLQGTLTTDRSADIFDILANSTGVVLAVLLFKRLDKFSDENKKNCPNK